MAIAKLQSGEPIVLDHTPSADVAAGAVVVIGNDVRIAHHSIAANQPGALSAGGAVYTVPKDTSTFADGAIVYWDESEQKASSSSDSNANKRMGTSVGAYATGATTMNVLHLANT
ncbi:hypothetical protein Spb1_20380 [Planctopirus ephydatiae]|uniref:DUF2190 family protein n=1 Tax=Planctopirus ephydatiae TaxID=2528019 RepID=A0A518GNB0_9PLAN|nr:DUF2190 family protein [Planctopirus ephydatiae]QDV30110.1 hypothetical protein Spb1_20380 [Planctopirus ephydatiae]